MEKNIDQLPYSLLDKICAAKTERKDGIVAPFWLAKNNNGITCLIIISMDVYIIIDSFNC